MSIFSEAARVGAEMEAAGQSGKGQLNVYACTPSLAGIGVQDQGWLWLLDSDH
jgi:hypothetical protein